MYEVQVDTHFDARHRLDAGGSPCAEHEHRWRVAVRAESSELDRIAIVVDFRKLRQQADDLVGRLAGKVLEDTSELGAMPATPAAVARWLLGEFRAMNAGEDYAITSVTVGCDPRIDFTVSQD